MNAFEQRWHIKYVQLEIFGEVFGTTNVRLRPWPLGHPVIPLARWVNQQRVRYRNGSISNEQEAKLKKVGLVFEFSSARKIGGKLGADVEARRLEKWVERAGLSYVPASEEKSVVKENANYLEYAEAKKVIISMRITTSRMYKEIVRRKVADTTALPKNIPSEPNVYYRGRGWKGWRQFLGTENRRRNNLMSYEEARAWAIEVGFKGVTEYRQHAIKPIVGKPPKPDNIPSNPEKAYQQWVSWPEFLGKI